MRTIVGIDNGTQSTKVLLYDVEKRRIAAIGRAPHRIISEANGRREQKAEWWIEALRTAFSQIDPDIRKTAAAIGVSGQQHGFVPLDARGKPVYNVKLWNDTEAAVECLEIMEAYGGRERMIREVGNPVLPGFTAGKILWLKKNRPEAYEKLDRILLPHDFLNYYLTGSCFTEAGDASGTAYFDIYKKRWSKEVLEAIDPDTDLYRKLPEVIESCAIGGYLTEERSRELGLPSGLPVSSGGGDNMMGAVGTGAVREGIVTVSMGTSGTIYSYREQPMVDPDERLSAFCSSSGGWLPLLCTMNCTVALEQFRGLLDRKLSEVNAVVTEISPGSDGLITLPFFNGERTPNLPRGKGCLVGMNGSNLTEGHMLRSAMESAAFSLKLGLTAFQAQGLSPEKIHLIGGGSNSPEWRRIMADVFETPLECPATEEAAALGAALQALWALQDGKVSIADICGDHIRYDSDRRTFPDEKNKAAYRDAYGLYETYIEVVTPLFR